ncbi:MAG: rod-binding protein [Thiohalomonadales bacterium]
MSVSFPSASNYTDIQGLQNLKNAADKNSPDALREAARQFEALFIQNMLKNMRAAKLDDGLLGSDQGDMYLDMFDKQLSLTLTKQKGIGLADMLYEQLKNTLADPSLNIGQSAKQASAETSPIVGSNPNEESTVASSAKFRSVAIDHYTAASLISNKK